MPGAGVCRQVSAGVGRCRSVLACVPASVGVCRQLSTHLFLFVSLCHCSFRLCVRVRQSVENDLLRLCAMVCRGVSFMSREIGV